MEKKGKRIISLACAFSVMFATLVGRCAFVSLGNSYKVADSYNSYTLKVGTLYTNIYDRTGLKLNNKNKTPVAVIRPNEKCLSELDKLFSASEAEEITKELSKGYPITRTVSKKANTKYIKILDRIDYGSNEIARHIIDKACGGLENYVTKELGSLSVNFSVDAMGRLLVGDEGSVINDNYDSNDGVVISIDSKLQQIAEDASKNIKKGAVVVMDTQTSQILASVSKGNDYVNRALSSYAVGSVFKLIVCACAIENGINPIYTCSSSIKINDMKVHCQNNHVHGMQDMKQALANSCNCYFVNLALKLGADKLADTAQALGFGKSYYIYNNWQVTAGFFPSKSTLSSKGQLALVGFGQGQLTDSPMHFASVISCIANGGNYNSPTLDIKDPSESQTISENTASKLQSYMKYVVTHGTGRSAQYKNATAGKTATAQSGIYQNNKEILNTWFAGFYPYNNPKYAIVVMCENGSSGAGDCCPVFRTIVENIDKK